jgi:RNA polymerase primary sigma factor
MKHKYESKDLQGLVNLGREQGYLTFDQVNDLLPHDVASAGDLRAAVESFESMDIKVLDEVPGEDTGAEAEADPEEEPEEESVADFSESSNPVRLYLKEMGNFQLLTREGEVEVARRIEAGEKEAEEEVLNSPIMLDYIIRMGEQIEAAEADLRDVFEDNDEADADEEKGPETDEAQRVRLLSFTKQLTKLRKKLKETEEARRAKPGPRRKSNLDKQHARLKLRVKDELKAMQLSPKVEKLVNGEMRRLLEEHRGAQRTISQLRKGHRPQQESATEGSGGSSRPQPSAHGQWHPREPAGHRGANPRSAKADQGDRAPRQDHRRRVGSFAGDYRGRSGQEPQGQEGIDRGQPAPGGQPGQTL